MSIDVRSREVLSDGSATKIIAGIGFDSSYVTGGEPLTAANLGLSEILSFEVTGNEAGYLFDYDYTNEKLKVYYANSAYTPSGTLSAAPPRLIVDKVLAVSSNQAVIDSTYGACYIISVEATAGGTTGVCDIIPNSGPPASEEVSIAWDSGTLTFAAADAVTACRVTYIPSQSGTFLDTDNFTYDEAVTASASKVALSERAAMVQYIYDATGGTFLTAIPAGEAPASGEVALDIDDGGSTTIDTNVDIDGNTLLVSYLPYANIPSQDMFITNSDITLNSENYSWVSDNTPGIGALVIPGFGGNLVGETGASANHAALWAGPATNAANDVARWLPAYNYFETNQSTAMVTAAISWLILEPSFIAPYRPSFSGNASAASTATEVANGTNLSSALNAVECIIIGR